MNPLKPFTIILIILLLAIQLAAAETSLTPGSREVAFNPGADQKVEFTVSGYGNIDFIISCPEWITINRDDIMKNGHDFKFFPIVNLPEEIDPPGRRACSIIVVEKIPESKGGITATTQVAAKIFVNVPYPGRYAEMSLLTQNVNKNDPLPIKVRVTNQGKEVLYNIHAKLELKDYLNNTIGTFFTDSETLESGQATEFEKIISTKLYDVGKYYVTATLDYGAEEPRVATNRIIIGEKFVNFIGIQNVTIGQIMRFYVDIESWWGNPIESTYADVRIHNETASISFKTISLKLMPWEKAQLYGFVENSNLGHGVYDVDITLNFDGEKRDFHSVVELYPIAEDETSYIDAIKSIATSPWILVAVVLLVIVFDLLWLRRKKSGSKEAKK
ncbi:MAG: hypothetical protein ABIB71_04960 [Candidatus Woesearchaeota archaeon]